MNQRSSASGQLFASEPGVPGVVKESRAISYTLCKGNPHDQQVFANPSGRLETVSRPNGGNELQSVWCSVTRQFPVTVRIFMPCGRGNRKRAYQLNSQWFWRRARPVGMQSF
ncbi:hypothetical protein KCP78_23150 [Salmonella enterica subsp. enterica]|nr:hypothetical protein KCP78_23150 [Salmonella enterica subsp. enterica]